MDAPTQKSNASDINGIQLKLDNAISSVDSAWGKFCAGSAEALLAFAESARQLVKITECLPTKDCHRLAVATERAATWLLDDPSRDSDSLTVEVATAILLLRVGLENVFRSNHDYSYQVDVMVIRMHGCTTGKPPKTTSGIPLLDELSVKAQGRILQAQVIGEMRIDFEQIRLTLSDFFSDGTRQEEISSLERPFNQICGALMQMQKTVCASALKDYGAAILRFSDPELVHGEDVLEYATSRFSQLLRFGEALDRGDSDFLEFLENMSSESGEYPGACLTAAALASQEAPITQSDDTEGVLPAATIFTEADLRPSESLGIQHAPAERMGDFGSSLDLSKEPDSIDLVAPSEAPDEQNATEPPQEAFARPDDQSDGLMLDDSAKGACEASPGVCNDLWIEPTLSNSLGSLEQEPRPDLSEAHSSPEPVMDESIPASVYLPVVEIPADGIGLVTQPETEERPTPADEIAASESTPELTVMVLSVVQDERIEPTLDSTPTAADDAQPDSPISSESVPLEPTEDSEAQGTMRVFSSQSYEDKREIACFLSDSAKTLRTIGESLYQLQAQPSAHTLQGIRQSFSRLKSDSRLAGQTSFGETAWAIEQAVNLWLRESRSPDGEIVSLLGEAFEVFSEWLSAIKGRSGLEPAWGDLVRRAAALNDSQAPSKDVSAHGESTAERSLQPNDFDVVNRLANEAHDLASVGVRLDREMMSLKGSLSDLVERVGRLRHQLQGLELSSRQSEESPCQDLVRRMDTSAIEVAAVRQDLLNSIEDASAVLMANICLNREVHQVLTATQVNPFASLTVLVVDGSDVMRRVTSRLLSRKGCGIMMAENGHDALAQMATDIPDVMLADADMPELDGLGLTRAVRADDRLKHIPIIMAGFGLAAESRSLAFEAGVDYLLDKPYPEESVLALISDIATRTLAMA